VSKIAADLILYGTTACHLCEVAEALLCALSKERPDFRFTKIDISDTDELVERYGIRIPVLRHPDGTELGWPFSPGDVFFFLDS
jgi:hypothetical protein